MSAAPFRNVKYFYPASDNQIRNSYVDEEIFERQRRDGKEISVLSWRKFYRLVKKSVIRRGAIQKFGARSSDGQLLDVRIRSDECDRAVEKRLSIYPVGVSKYVDAAQAGRSRSRTMQTAFQNRRSSDGWRMWRTRKKSKAKTKVFAGSDGWAGWRTVESCDL